MPVTGKGRRKVLIVAEAPGEQEDKRGVQLIGEAGQLLRGILEGIGVDLEDCWKTNSVICHPPGNKMEDLYIESCRPNLTNTIRELKPKVIILLGLAAVQSLLTIDWGDDIGPMARWAGWQIPSEQFNAWICPTYHPSFIKRENENAALMKIVERQLQSAFDLEAGRGRPGPEAYISCDTELITAPSASRRRISELGAKEGVLAFDYETDGLKPELPQHEIYAASFCLNGEDTFSCRVDGTCHDALRLVLRNPRLKKVASNLKFEERWSIQKLGTPVAGWFWDTMLAAHYLDNRRDITSIKFQLYVMFGLKDYSTAMKPYLQAKGANGFNRIREAPLEDLLRYCGIDSFGEYKAMEVQRKVLGYD